LPRIQFSRQPIRSWATFSAGLSKNVQSSTFTEGVEAGHCPGGGEVSPGGEASPGGGET
jgi:hypothetical protein